MRCLVYTRAGGNIVLCDFAETLNSAFFVLSLAGIWAQLRKIGARKHADAGGRPTAILSLNQFWISLRAPL